MTTSVLLLLHLCATGYMAGLIWFVQLVHYPLMGRVGRLDYRAYQLEHMSRTTWAVSPMLVEAGTAVALLFMTTLAPWPLKALSLTLLAVVWASTALIQVPAHNALVAAFELSTHRRLVNTNWLRTVCWSLRLLLAASFVGLEMR